MEILMFTLRLIVLLLLLVLVLMVLGLCKAASERDRAEEEAAQRTGKYHEPHCYNPNNNPYPLCKGDGSEECQYCCLYENFPEPPFDK